MEMRKENMIAAFYWTPGSYPVLPAKAMVPFLPKLSKTYLPLFRIRGQEMSKELEVGCEESWTGIGKQLQ